MNNNSRSHFGIYGENGMTIKFFLKMYFSPNNRCRFIRKLLQSDLQSTAGNSKICCEKIKKMHKEMKVILFRNFGKSEGCFGEPDVMVYFKKAKRVYIFEVEAKKMSSILRSKGDHVSSQIQRFLNLGKALCGNINTRSDRNNMYYDFFDKVYKMSKCTNKEILEIRDILSHEDKICKIVLIAEGLIEEKEKFKNEFEKKLHKYWPDKDPSLLVFTWEELEKIIGKKYQRPKDSGRQGVSWIINMKVER